MATTRAQRQVYADLLNRYGRSVADAFLEAIEKITSAVSIQRLTAAIEARDIERALEVLDIDPADFNDVLDRIRDAHRESGKATASQMPKRKPDGTALNIRFDGRNPQAESWLQQRSSQLITRTVADQRTAIRSALSESMARGANPRTTALDLVGRVSRVSGKREGGILGLTSPQEEALRKARSELASSDPAGLRNYLGRGRRNRLFDRSITKAIREGRAVDPAIAQRALKGYANGLLKLRGEMIGKHETFSAIEAAKEEAYRQAVASGKLSANAVSKIWRHFSSRNPRHQHIAANGQRVGLSGLFVMPDGTLMRHAHDPSAPISHTAGCLCQTDYDIDFYADLT